MSVIAASKAFLPVEEAGVGVEGEGGAVHPAFVLALDLQLLLN